MMFDTAMNFDTEHIDGGMSWTSPSNMVELFHGSPFSHVFDIF